MKNRFAFLGHGVRGAEHWVLGVLAATCLLGARVHGMSITGGSAVSENFDSMGATLVLPSGWKMGLQSSTPSWNAGVATNNLQASSGSPTTGGTYNWGATGGTDRAVGAMTSSSFSSPNSLLGVYTNQSGSTITNLSVSYSIERYRVNTAAASNRFYYSLDGAAWTLVPAGVVSGSSLPTGASAYGYPRVTDTVNVPSFPVAVVVTNQGVVYLRWNLDTTGASSQGLGIDDISVAAQFAPAVPAVTTDPATATNTSTATVGGTVTSEGGSAVTNRGVCYGTGTGIAIDSNKTAAATAGSGSFTVDLSGLSVNTRYYFKAFAENTGGPVLGSELTFTTWAQVPGAPTVGGATPASLNLSIEANGNPSATEYALQVTNDSSWVQADGTLGGAAFWTNQWFTKTVIGLSPAQEYGFRVKARNLEGVETALGSVGKGTTTSASTPALSVLGDPLTLAFGFVVAGHTSAVQSITVSGTNLTDVLSVTSPAPFAISTTADAGFDSSVTLVPLDGVVNPTNVYVRMVPPAVAAYATNITLSSPGANRIEVAVTGTGTLAAEPGVHASGLQFSALTTGQMDVAWTPGDGSNRLVVARQGSAPSGFPVDATSYAAQPAYGSGDPLGGGYVVYSGPDQAFTLTGLSAGATYYVAVYEYNGSGITLNYYTGGTPLAGSQPTVPDAPASLTATNITSSAFHANWQAAAGATNYLLDAATDPTFAGGFLPGCSNRAVGNVTTFAVYGLSPNATYYYQVRAQNAGGISVSSAAQTVTTLAALASLTTTPVSAILDTTALSGGDVTSTGGVEVTSRGVCWSATGLPTTGDACTTNGSGAGVFTSTLTGLIPGQVYTVRAYAVNSVGTSYGNAQTFTTLCFNGVVTGLSVSGVSTGSFLVSWPAVAEATGYRIEVSTNSTFAGPARPASDLFISEYIEGPSNEKYIEIFNGTGGDVSLTGYALLLFGNGSATATASNALTGTLTNGGVAVYRNGSATNSGTSATSVNFNGDDALALWKRSTASYADIFGRIGEDPGTAWTNGLVSTENQTLVRQSSVWCGITNNPANGFPTLTTEWDAYPIGDESRLGSHAFAGGPGEPDYLAGYSNLAVAGTSVAVTGLTPGVTYYFRVRAERAGSCFSGYSSHASVTTFSPPVVDPVTLARDYGQPLHVAAAALATNAYDRGGGPVTCVWVSAVSSNGHPVSLTNGWVYYLPPAASNETDTFAFRLANNQGVEAESTATILVNSPVTNSQSISGAVATQGGNYFRWSGIPGRTQLVEGATSLGPEPPADWAHLTSAVIGVLGYAEYVETNPPSPRFYRILEQRP